MVIIILPLWMIGLAAIAVLYVKESAFSTVGEICVVVFLTIVTYSVGLAPVIQSSSTLTVADKVFFGTFLTVFLVFIKVVTFGLFRESFQVWVANRAVYVGTIALALYSTFMLLAITGLDVSLMSVINE